MNLVPFVHGLALAASLAAGTGFWPFDTDAERLVQQARLSRERLDFGGASALLDQAAGQDPLVEAQVIQERGLLARDRNDLERALTLLKRAADTDPSLPARVDQAAVLVQMGRWPEAVTVLRQAFDERGAGLPIEQINADKRFIKLVTLKPYQDLLDAARADQSGPFGKVMVRLERLQASANSAEHGLQRLAQWFTFFRDLLTDPIAALALLLFIGLFITSGVREFGLFKPPWSLVVGMGSAALIWALAARALSAGGTYGRDTILMALGCSIVLWAIGAGCRWGWRRYKRSQHGAADPFAAEHLPDTLVLVDEISRLGHRVVSARRREQRVLAEALRQAGETLRERLDKGA